MTVAISALGRPPAAELRGGDCRARDLTQARNVGSPHRFAATTDCRINNGIVRLTVGASGSVPTLTVAARRGPVVVGDVYVDTYADLYGGSMSSPSWQDMGSVVIDSPSLSALLTGVRLVRVDPFGAYVTIRLVAPLIGDAFVTLRRGNRGFTVQHGSTRAPLVTTTRRVRWNDSPAVAGIYQPGRMEETPPAVQGFSRFVALIDTPVASSGGFYLSTASVTSAQFGVGVGTSAARDTAAALHSRFSDSSRLNLDLQPA